MQKATVPGGRSSPAEGRRTTEPGTRVQDEALERALRAKRDSLLREVPFDSTRDLRSARKIATGAGTSIEELCDTLVRLWDLMQWDRCEVSRAYAVAHHLDEAEDTTGRQRLSGFREHDTEEIDRLDALLRTAKRLKICRSRAALGALAVLDTELAAARQLFRTRYPARGGATTQVNSLRQRMRMAGLTIRQIALIEFAWLTQEVVVAGQSMKNERMPRQSPESKVALQRLTDTVKKATRRGTNSRR